MHNNKPVSEMGTELFARKEEPRLQGSGEHLEGTLGAPEESTSAEKGKLAREAVLDVGASSEEEDERTQEWWEGYDPGRDARF